MARRRKLKVDHATIRGVHDGGGNSWWMTLIQVPGPPGPVDLDTIVARLIEGGVVGQHQRDVGSAVLAGTIPPPSGQWALLIALRGQPWAYLTPSDYETPRDLARRSGLRTLGAGYQDTANATALEVFEGPELLVEFESCGMSGGEDAEDEEIGPDTRFASSRLPSDWFRQFASEDAVQQALAREFDAYVPSLGASSYGSSGIQLYGFGEDGAEFAAEDYERIDLIGFGAAQLSPTASAQHLLDAIRAGDLPGLRAAVAAGADLRTLPGLTVSPLTLALARMGPDAGSRAERVAALLDLGADPANPGGEAPLHAVLDDGGAGDDQAETIATLAVLLDRGVPVDEPGRALLTQGRTPLHVVARRRWLAIAKFLLSRGADVRATGGPGGQTPRQVAEGVAELMQEQLGRNEPVDQAMVALLADAEAGRANLDWQADPEAAHHAAVRRRREFQVGLGRIGAGFRALQALDEPDPTPQAIVDAVVLTQPAEIHLEPIPAPRGKNLRTALRPALDAAGFRRFGSYQMAELPKIRLDAYHLAAEHLILIHYEAAGRSILDLVRYHNDATRLTVTNNEVAPEVQFEMPDRQTVRRPGGSLADLLLAARAEAPPAAGVLPIDPADFVARFEDSYRREMKARQRAVRRS